MNRGVLAGLKRLLVPPPLGGDPANDGMALVLDSTQEGGVRGTQSRVITAATLIVKALTGQTGNLTEWKDETGANVASMSPIGNVILNGNGATIAFAGGAAFQRFGGDGALEALGHVSAAIPVFRARAQAVAQIVMTARGVAGQTGDLHQWQNSAATPLARIDKNGKPAFSEAANGSQGVATLVGGTVTVANTNVTANSRIFLTVQSLGGIAAPVGVAVTGRTAGTSFTITSASALDTSVVAYEIFEPA